MDNSLFERVEEFKYLGTNKKPKFFLGRNEEQMKSGNVSLNGWKSLNIWGKNLTIKILFRKLLGAN
jgi:hypothetical protein